MHDASGVEAGHHNAPISIQNGNYRRRLCRRLIGIFDPIVLGGPCNVTGCCAVVAPPPDGEYARSNRVTTGLRSPDGTNAPGLASVQSAGGGRGTNPSTCATGMTMLIRFSILVSSSP